MSEELKPQVDEDPEDSSRKMDPELRLMGLLLRKIEDLEPPARARVVAWLSSRYQEGK